MGSLLPELMAINGSRAINGSVSRFPTFESDSLTPCEHPRLATCQIVFRHSKSSRPAYEDDWLRQSYVKAFSLPAIEADWRQPTTEQVDACCIHLRSSEQDSSGERMKGAETMCVGKLDRC